MQTNATTTTRRAAAAAGGVTLSTRRTAPLALPALSAWDHPNRIEAHELRGLGVSLGRFGYDA